MRQQSLLLCHFHPNIIIIKDYVTQTHDHIHSHIYAQRADISEKIAMVPCPHTVINPLTVVVKPTHALVTDIAVAGVSPA